MGIFGKWLGGGLGFVMGGPIGGLLGFLVGSCRQLQGWLNGHGASYCPGHTRIGFIGKPNLTSSIERFDGYKHSLQKYNIPFDPELVRVAENASINGGAQITGELLNINNPPTAIFLVNDMLAIGAVRVIQEKGLSVPGDISIVGFDDVPLAQCVNPPLTTVRQPAFEKGVKAARMLIQILERRSHPSRKYWMLNW